MRRTRATPAGVSDEDDRFHTIHEYKQCMIDVKNDYPHLSMGAQQQLALERCTRMIDDKEGERHEKRKPMELLRGMILKLRIGKNHRSDAASPAGGGEVGSTIDSASKKNNFTPGTQRPSLAVLKSVASLTGDIQNVAAQSTRADLSENENEESLQDSLEKIERKSSNIFDKPSSNPNNNWRARRHLTDSNGCSSRVSAISLDLPSVEEDGESVSSNKKGATNLAALSSSKDRSNTSSQKNIELHQSVSDILPDEIKMALDNFTFGDTEENGQSPGVPLPAHRRNRVFEPSQRDSTTSQPKIDEHSNSSCMSSVLSMDSANFNGDFSAW
eukprot:CAMPEP_0181121056 /NCGR_PEP_ID=MMETSP1071-20121207/24520_1 /TAXON_ID=35127 /ORGANISM="Thalassiosira sp., Strain NH16" /LENGTH=328 /DNA_ID=CAMNT_0023205821 /DNA_START=1 /DNA_END=984 /DNA_ORIENTATION=-